MRLLSLPTHLRAWGLEVVEVDGWRTRGAAYPRLPRVVVAHHTGTPAKVPGDLPTRQTLIQGRSDLPGPLCQLGLARSGVVHVIASGKANHAGDGSWAGLSVGNSASVGIEAEHPGGKAGWPAEQLAAYDLLAAALLDLLKQPSTHLCGHKESARPLGRKVDPNLDMNAMRGRVARLLTAGPRAQSLTKPTPAGTTPTAQEDRMEIPIVCTQERSNWLGQPGTGACTRITAVAMDVIRKTGVQPVEIASEAAMKNALRLP